MKAIGEGWLWGERICFGADGLGEANGPLREAGPTKTGTPSLTMSALSNIS